MASKKQDDNGWFWGLLIGAIGTYIVLNDKKPTSDRIIDPLQKMQEMVYRFKTAPQIREWAAFLIKGCHPMDQICHINKIFRFVSDQIAYMSDPHGMDYFSTPFETLQIRAGDCDCKAILLATLLEACGNETRFVMIPNHVFVEVAIKRSNIHKVPRYWFRRQNSGLWWIPLDSTASRSPLGTIDINKYEEARLNKQVRVL
jgi:hypothetical protein